MAKVTSKKKQVKRVCSSKGGKTSPAKSQDQKKPKAKIAPAASHKKALFAAGKRSRSGFFWSPEGLERLCRIVIGCLNPEQIDQQTLSMLSGVSPASIGKMRENFYNSAEGRVIRAIEPELVLDLAPHISDADGDPYNPWFLMFVGCGFLDGRDSSELYKGVSQLQKVLKSDLL
jgi:hypothetical protein